MLPTRAHSLAIEAAAQMLELAARSLSELFAGFLQARNGATIGSIQDSIRDSLANPRRSRVRSPIREPSSPDICC